MTSLQMLETAIGLILVYLVLSLFCTSVTESIAQAGSLRGKNLRAAIKGLLGGSEELTKNFYDHPAICVLRAQKTGHLVHRP